MIFFTCITPFRFASRGKAKQLAVPELAKHFPVIEYNMQDLNRRICCYGIATDLGKGIAVSTDSHTGLSGRIYNGKGDDFRKYFTTSYG
jgi:hypothetical protein